MADATILLSYDRVKPFPTELGCVLTVDETSQPDTWRVKRVEICPYTQLKFRHAQAVKHWDLLHPSYHTFRFNLAQNPVSGVLVDAAIKPVNKDRLFKVSTLEIIDRVLECVAKYQTTGDVSILERVYDVG